MVRGKGIQPSATTKKDEEHSRTNRLYDVGNRMNIFLQGLRFGMILQIAVGPVSMFILTTAINSSLLNSLLAVLAVTLIDGIFIILALSGITSFVRDERNKTLLKWLSAMILVLFGADIILETLHIHLLPSINMIETGTANNSFIYALVLTASSPLTILFWAGVFSTRIVDTGYRNTELYTFALGCLSSTPLFLGILSFIGSYFHYLLPQAVITALNITAGSIMIYFAARVFVHKANDTAT